jgi:hypothetical protein
MLACPSGTQRLMVDVEIHAHIALPYMSNFSYIALVGTHFYLGVHMQDPQVIYTNIHTVTHSKHA